MEKIIDFVLLDIDRDFTKASKRADGWLWASTISIIASVGCMAALAVFALQERELLASFASVGIALGLVLSGVSIAVATKYIGEMDRQLNRARTINELIEEIK